jgi:hypothetical protein
LVGKIYKLEGENMGGIVYSYIRFENTSTLTLKKVLVSSSESFTYTINYTISGLIITFDHPIGTVNILRYDTTSDTLIQRLKEENLTWVRENTWPS